MSINRYEIRLPAEKHSLNRVYDFFRETSQDIGLSPQAHFDIELSIEEALTNVITHAYEDYIGDFMLRITHEGNWVEITIQDWGKPFNPDTIKPFDYSAPVHTRINGGMGVHFMRTLMDSVQYRFDEVEGTILTMTKNLDPFSQPPPIQEQIEHELQVFDDVARAISTEHDLNTLLDLIVDKLTDVVNADRGTLYLLDHEEDELVSKILQDETGRLSEIRLKVGEGIAGHVAATGETINIKSAEDSPYFAKNFDKRSGYQTRTMICTPMRDALGQINGVVQLLNKRDGVFTRRDEVILQVLASQAAIAIENARLLASEQERRRVADTLREVSSIINSAFELEEVLALILREVERVLPFESTAILLIEGEELVVRAARGFSIPIEYSLPIFRLDENALIHELVQSRTPIIIPDVLEDPRWIDIEETRGIRSWLGIPLIVENHVIGELGLNHGTPSIYRQFHAEIALTFANQAAAAIERARLHQQTLLQARLQQEAETARRIQSSLLPDAAPQIEGWDIAASWQPAKEVAGDFYDFIDLPEDRLGFVVADVCGKGIPASLFMAVSRTVFRVLALADTPPALLLADVNNKLKAESTANMFVTLFYGILNIRTGELHYSNGGHNPPILLRQHGDTLSIGSSGPALGVFPNVPYEATTLTIVPGDVLVVYTDGVTEAINDEEEEFEEDRLTDCISDNRDETAQLINHSIQQAVREFTADAPPADDATILVIKRTVPS